MQTVQFKQYNKKHAKVQFSGNNIATIFRRRGKPLYLSQSRYWLLEQQWLSIRFDHTNKKWVWHRDGL